MLVESLINIKEYLKNVYFITGTPCGGKTTVSRALAEKYGFELFSDKRIKSRRTNSNCSRVLFNSQFLYSSTVLLDLIRLSENKKVLCDCHLTVAQALAFSEPARVVFLIKDPSNLVDEYGNRPDHQGFFQYLYSSTVLPKNSSALLKYVFIAG